MTEADWLTGSVPLPMLSLLRDKADPRKLRLLRIAAARLEWDKLPEYPYRRAVEAAEAYVEGGITAEELAEFNSSLYRVFSPDAEKELRNGFLEAKNRSNELPDLKGNFTDAFVLHSLCHAACQSEKLIQVPDGGAIWGLVFLRLSARLTPLIRDIFGNPFRPVVIDPAWLTPAVIELAQAIYSDRSSERAAEIAGLLKNAGCTNDCILEHCLSTQPHFRGCWVIDAMLARQ